MLAIARGEYKPKFSEPKVWFTSIKFLAEILSDDNRALLHVIMGTKPGSIAELALATGRKPSNLSRTLKTMLNYGIVGLKREKNFIHPIANGYRVSYRHGLIYVDLTVAEYGDAMVVNAKTKNAILSAVRETAIDLYRLGFVDKRKMQKYEALCLESVPEYDAEKIRALRARLNLSQAVLAAALNTSPLIVRKWEIGDKRPSRPSQKLLNLIDRKGLEAVL